MLEKAFKMCQSSHPLGMKLLNHLSESVVEAFYGNYTGQAQAEKLLTSVTTEALQVERINLVLLAIDVCRTHPSRMHNGFSVGKFNLHR